MAHLWGPPSSPHGVGGVEEDCGHRPGASGAGLPAPPRHEGPAAPLGKDLPAGLSGGRAADQAQKLQTEMTGLIGDLPVTEPLGGRVPGPPPPATQESCSGLPASRFIHPKTIPAPCVTQAHPWLGTHHPLSWEEETATENVDRVPRAFLELSGGAWPSQRPGGLPGGGGRATRCRRVKRGHEVHGVGFWCSGDCGDRLELPEHGPACGARLPASSPSCRQRGRARGCRAPPGGVPRGWDAVGALLGVNGWAQPGGLTQVLFESEERE